MSNDMRSVPDLKTAATHAFNKLKLVSGRTGIQKERHLPGSPHCIVAECL